MRSSLILVAALLLAGTGIACAQVFPTKPIRLVTRYAPGSSGDTTLRTVTGPWSEAIGQPIVLDSRPGAGGVLAAETVAHAAPDGYTLLGTSPATQVFRQFLVKKLSFDPIKDFTPITTLIDPVAVIVAYPAVPAQSLQGLIDYARANPGKVTYGTAGIGSEFHLAAEQLSQLAHVDWSHVPYKSGAQGLLDVVSGRVMTGFAVYSAAAPHIKSGKVRPLAIMRSKRLAGMSQVPTIAEVVPGFEPVPSWSGIFGPGEMPPALVRRLNSDIVSVLNRADVREKLADAGYDVIPSTPEEFASLLRRNIELAGRVIKAAGLKPE